MIAESRISDWNFEVELPTGLKVKGPLASSSITVMDTPVVNWKKDASARHWDRKWLLHLSIDNIRIAG